MNIRVRYAPSPTGLQHIGSMRTALINYLFARANGGKFILRIEDTDRTRCLPEYTQNMYDTFKWLDFYWDEGPDVGGPFGPYVQSERFDIYGARARELVESGMAYYCFCKEAELAELRASQDEEAKSGKGYDRRCRNIPPAEASARIASGEKAVIRLKIPLDGTTRFHDLVLGDIEFKNKDISPDPILLKSDGFPTYHLANIIDDHMMEISHVMRAQEWLSSAPLHIIMYKAFGWEPPQLVHLPMVMGSDGHKLSKRHGATAVDEFRKAGYLPEALINYVSHLGCSFEEGRDIFPLKDLERLFKIEKINKAPAVFDYKKLEWYNGQYIRMKGDDELIGLVTPVLAAAGLVSDPLTAGEREILVASMPLARERLHFINDAANVLGFILKDDIELPPIEEMIPKKLDAARMLFLLGEALPLIRELTKKTNEEVEEELRAKAEGLGAKLGDMLMPVRVAVTGSRASPPLFDSMRVLGIDKSVARIEKALKAFA